MNKQKTNSTAYQPYIMGLVYGVAILLLFIAYGLFIEQLLVENNLYDTVVGIVKLSAPFIGTFLGAYYAFKFNTKITQNEKRRNNIDAVNQAILVLVGQYSQIINIENQSIKPAIREGNTWYTIQPAYQFKRVLEGSNFTALSFLIASHGLVVQKLAREEDTYVTICELMQLRFNAFENEVHPALMAAEYKTGSEAPIDEIAGFLRPTTLAKLKFSAESIVDLMAKSKIGIRLVYQELCDALLDVYPDANPLQIDFDLEVPDP